jgi:DNA-binding response OmpR family regulator
MSPQEGQIEASNIRVLCVEDEQFISELYERAMVKAGYDVTTVRSGKDALREILSGNYDIVLLDIMIPDILGVDVLQRIRHDAPHLKSKIIIATNLEQDDETREAIEKQADGYIIKAEMTPKELVKFLDQL